jgi:hypothetical protein
MPAVQTVEVVEIGGIPISLSTSDDMFRTLLRERYAGFISTSAPECELEFDTTVHDPTTEIDLEVRRDSGDWILQRGDFLARWNPRTRRGFVRQNASPYSLDSVLRIIHSLILAERGGFLLHASSGICDGRAFLFSGVSGAGKTTMTRIAPSDVTLLTDEISYVRPNKVRPDEDRPKDVRTENDRPDPATSEHAPDKSGYLAFGTPFSGELAKPGENCVAPIAALFFLEKGPENRIDSIDQGEAVRRLMRNILFFAEDRNLAEKLLATACDFVSRVPVWRLTFYPDGRVWDHIRDFKKVAQHVG